MIYPYKDAQPVEWCRASFAALDHGKVDDDLEITLKQGSRGPAHAHPHEQVGDVTSGKVRITVGDESTVLGPGDCYYAPSGVMHGAQVLEKAVVVDTLETPREDYR